MKINSNTISLEKEDHAKLEEIVTKIASDNSIENIEAVNITLTQENGLVSFKEAGKGCGYVSEKDEDKKKVAPKGEGKEGKKMTPGDLKTMGMAK
jgi:hypothetical protein